MKPSTHEMPSIEKRLSFFKDEETIVKLQLYTQYRKEEEKEERGFGEQKKTGDLPF